MINIVVIRPVQKTALKVLSVQKLDSTKVMAERKTVLGTESDWTVRTTAINRTNQQQDITINQILRKLNLTSGT